MVVMSRKEWFTANIIELGGDLETVLSMPVSMQVTGSADCLSLVWLSRWPLMSGLGSAGS